MVQPPPGSVILLLNLNHTDVAPGGELSAQAVHFPDQMTGQWKLRDFSESSRALEPGSSFA